MITIVMAWWTFRFENKRGWFRIGIFFPSTISNRLQTIIHIYISYRIVLECNAMCKRDVIKVEGGRGGYGETY